MRAKELPSAQYLHECFRYDEETGDLIWRERPVHHFKNEHYRRVFRTRWAGKVAGRPIEHNGRRRRVIVPVNNRPNAAHRVIWTMLFGVIPTNILIDHINGDPWDNRRSNLRLANKGQNSANSRVQSRTGRWVRGAFPGKGTSFYSTICVDGHTKYLGTFPTKGLAAVAYAKASIMHHGRYSAFLSHDRS